MTARSEQACSSCCVQFASVELQNDFFNFSIDRCREEGCTGDLLVDTTSPVCSQVDFNSSMTESDMKSCTVGRGFRMFGFSNINDGNEEYSNCTFDGVLEKRSAQGFDSYATGLTSKACSSCCRALDSTISAASSFRFDHCEVSDFIVMFSFTCKSF